MPALRNRSNASILSNLDTLVRDERRRIVEILHHLNEVDTRRLYLELGYSSLFDYCVSRLRYSESAAGRRVAVARALRRHPDIGPMLESGELTLMSVGMVARILTPSNARNILDAIRGRSKREVEEIVSGHRPESVLRDRVRRVCLRVPAATPAPTGGTESGAPNPMRSLPTSAPPRTLESAGQEHNGDARLGAETPAGTDTQPATAVDRPSGESSSDTITKTLIRFAAGDEFMLKLARAKALLSHRMPGASLEQIFDAALEAFLDKHCPERREERRRQRRSRREEQHTEPRESCHAHHDAPTTTPAARGETRGRSLPPVGVRNDPGRRTRHVPGATRDRVIARDGGRCTYVSPSGRRCGATSFLQVDHIVPFARGGVTSPSNLRLLCGPHNRMEARRLGLDRPRQRE